ncbi:MAG: exopolysaccharide biosynthesis protein [Alphaproteobacteria bacterium]|nr:exopolysaccharide biosynthesis protein [Alphaproteobacteria bacterium]
MSIRSLSHLLDDIREQVKDETVSLAQLLEMFHERGFGFFLFLFALPAALPMPAIGINAIIALPLLLLTAQQALGRHTIWIPQKMSAKTISQKRIYGFVDGARPWIKRLEFFIRPRLGFITQGVFSNIIGAMGFIMALAVSIPLPLTNTVPAFGIALMSVGVLMRDGLAVIAGALIGLAWVTLLTVFMIYFGTEGIDMIKEFIKSLF